MAVGEGGMRAVTVTPNPFLVVQRAPTSGHRVRRVVALMGCVALALMALVAVMRDGTVDGLASASVASKGPKPAPILNGEAQSPGALGHILSAAQAAAGKKLSANLKMHLREALKAAVGHHIDTKANPSSKKSSQIVFNKKAAHSRLAKKYQSKVLSRHVDRAAGFISVHRSASYWEHDYGTHTSHHTHTRHHGMDKPYQGAASQSDPWDPETDVHTHDTDIQEKKPHQSSVYTASGDSSDPWFPDSDQHSLTHGASAHGTGGVGGPAGGTKDPYPRGGGGSDPYSADADGGVDPRPNGPGADGEIHRHRVRESIDGSVNHVGGNGEFGAQKIPYPSENNFDVSENVDPAEEPA